MYLNIGSEMLLESRRIIGIFDLDSANTEGDTKALLKQAEKAGRMVRSGYELPKSFLLTEDGMIYLSQFSANILKSKARGVSASEKDSVKKAREQLNRVKRKKQHHTD